MSETETIQINLAYTIPSSTELSFVITSSSGLYVWSLLYSNDGETWESGYDYMVYYPVIDYFTYTFTLNNDAKYFKLVISESRDANVSIKEFSLFTTLGDILGRVFPKLTSNVIQTTTPSIPSSPVGVFSVLSPPGSIGPANLFDLSSNSIYESDVSYDTNGRYIGNDTTYYDGYTYAGSYIEITFPFGLNINTYSFITTTNTEKVPENWIVFGTTDGLNWDVIIDTQLNFVGEAKRCYTFNPSDPNTAIKKFKFVCTSTIGSPQMELYEFSIASFSSGGRIIPVTLPGVSQFWNVDFGVSLGNAVDVYSGIQASQYNEWVRFTFPGIPDNLRRVVFYGDYLPSDVLIYDYLDPGISTTITGNFSVTGSVTIDIPSTFSSTFDFMFVFQALQPNIDAYPKIRISSFEFLDQYGNRLNFVWDPTVNFSSSGIVNSVNTIPGGKYIGETRTLTDNGYLYGEWVQQNFPDTQRIYGYTTTPNASGWVVCGKNSTSDIWTTLDTRSIQETTNVYTFQTTDQLYTDYRLVITNTLKDTFANVQDFTILNSLYERLDGSYSGGYYTGSTSFIAGYPGEYIMIPYQGQTYVSTAQITSNNSVATLNILTSNNAIDWKLLKTVTDNRVPGTYICNSVSTGETIALLAPTESIEFECPRACRIYSFSFVTCPFTLNFSTSPPTSLYISGSNNGTGWEQIQEYNQILQYNTKSSFDIVTDVEYKYYKVTFSSFLQDSKFLAIKEFQIYDEYSNPILSSSIHTTVIRQIPSIVDIQTTAQYFAFIFNNVETRDGILTIDSLVLS